MKREAITNLKRRITGRLIAPLIICLLFIISDFYGEGLGVCAFAQETQTAPEQLQQLRKAQSNSAWTGEFKVLRPRPKFHLSARASSDMWARVRRLESLAAMLNRRMSLPQDLYISLKNCGEPDAYYDNEEHRIVVCNELLNRIQNQFSSEIRNRARLNRSVLGALTFLFFHEVGHALIDVLKLPVTGREEDAVDQFSTIILLSQSPEDEQMVLDGANAFRWQARRARKNREPNLYWDQHSPDSQRFYDTICLLYGKNPKKYFYLVRRGTLPFDRGDVCPVEFERASRAWNTILAPYLKEPLPTSEIKKP